jgi:hypothetical protein
MEEGKSLDEQAGDNIRTEADEERKRKNLWEGKEGNPYMEGQARRRISGRA